MPLPEAIWSAKGGKAAFGGNARAGEDDDGLDVGLHGMTIDEIAWTRMGGEWNFSRFPYACKSGYIS